MRRGTMDRAGATAAIVVAIGLAGCGPGGGSDAERTSVTDEGFEQAVDAAEKRLETGDRDAAETILAAALRRRPDDPRARELLGRVALGRASDAAARGASPERVADHRREAWAQYRRAVAERPDDAALHVSAGLVALGAGDAAAALELLDRASELDPALPQPRLFAGQIHLQREDHAAAARAFEAVLALDPSEPYAHSSLAMVRLAEGRPDEAVALVAEARAIDPADPALRVQEVRVLRLAGRPDAAVARILAIPEAERIAMGLTSELAASQLALGRPEDAAAAWEAAWRRAASAEARADAALGVATALAETDRVEDAWSWVARVRETGHPGGLDRLADLEQRLRAARPATVPGDAG